MKELDGHTEFWECFDLEEEDFSDQVEVLVVEKLKRKVKELVYIIVTNDGQS